MSPVGRGRRGGTTRTTAHTMHKTTPRLLRSPASRGLVVAVVLVVCVAVAPEALGCPNCKDAVSTADPEGLNMARGYFYSILLMLAMPFTLVGSFGIYVWREMRRQRQSSAGAAEQPLGGQGVASPPTAVVP
jgi:hypothetical protein